MGCVMTEYVFSAKNNCFIEAARIEEYETFGWDLSDAKPVSNDVFLTFTQDRTTEGFRRAAGSDGLPFWEQLPPTPNSELLKAALAALSGTYQDDIEKLNRAWLAAAVNDGVDETAKKDVVLAQINTRKIQYANDRAAIIAQYH